MHRPLNITVSKYGMDFKESEIMSTKNKNTRSPEQISILDRLFSYLKMDDICVYYDGEDNLHAKDGENNDWINEDVYNFIFKEALCFDDKGDLLEGCYVEHELLESVKTFASDYGIYP